MSDREETRDFLEESKNQARLRSATLTGCATLRRATKSDWWGEERRLGSRRRKLLIETDVSEAELN